MCMHYLELIVNKRWYKKNKTFSTRPDLAAEFRGYQIQMAYY